MKRKGILCKILILFLTLSISIPYFPAQAESRTSSENKFVIVTEAAAKDSPTLSVDQKSENKVLPPGLSSVAQDAYSAESPTITRLKKLTVEKQNQFTSSAKSKTNVSGLTVQEDNASRDLSKAEVEELVRAGASVEDIYWLNYLHQGNEGIAVIDLFNQKKEGGQSWEEIEQELTAGNKASNSVQESVYDESALSSDLLSLISLTTVSDDVYLTSGLNELNLQQTTFSTTSFDVMVSSVIGGLASQDFIHQSAKEQYSDRNGDSELIDPASGSLNWQTQLLTLPGREGLDLNIGLMFQSTQAFAYTRKYSTTSSGKSNYVERYNYPAYRYDLGVGWSFQFPSVEYTDTYSYYHDGHGATYEISSEGATGLLGFSDRSVKYVINNYSQSPYTFNNGEETSVSYLEHSDGKREYFGQDGRLLGIVDRFGNTLTFRYSNRITFDGSTHYVLASITDTVGRVVTFNYETTLNTTGTFYGENVEIVAKSGATEIQKITLTKDRMSLTKNGIADGYAPTLWKFVNNAEPTQITSFEYGKSIANFDFYHKSTANQMYGWTSYHPMTAINFPNSKMSYTYDTVTRNLGSDGFSDDLRVGTRQDSIGTKIYNNLQYSYTNDYSGAPDYKSLYYVPIDYTYSSTTTVKSATSTGQMATKVTYNNLGEMISTSTLAANGERKVTKNMYFDNTFTSYPTQTETFDYAVGDTDATATHLYIETLYNERGQVKSQTRPLTREQWIDTNVKTHYTTFYTYDTVSQQVDTKKWYQNLGDASPLTEYYTYPHDGKSRLSMFTNDKGDKTSYTYSLNDIGQVSQVTAETVSDNKLTAKSVVKYGSEYSYAYPTEQQSWVNVGKADQQIVTTTMNYTPGGLLKNQTDGNQKTTSYEYDSIGRPTKITYPMTTDSNGYKYSETDNVSYVYLSPSDLDAVNQGTPTLEVSSTKTVTQLTAAGATVRSVNTLAKSYYNGLGLLLLQKQYDEVLTSWVSTQYHYDDQGRAVYVIDDQKNTILASYDEWGRLSKQTDALLNTYSANYNLKTRTTESYMNPSGSTEKYNYVSQTTDQWGQVISSMTYRDLANKLLPISEKYTYDLAGNVTSYIDPENHVNDEGVTTAYRYDILNRLIAVKDALSQTTNYTYDGNGQISRTTIQALGGQPQVINEKTYNELGQITEKKDASGAFETIKYNALGLPLSSVDRAGTSYTYDYNERQQLTTEKLVGVINNVAQTQETKYSHSTSDILTQMVNVSTNGALVSSQSVQTDSQGRVRTVQATIGSSFNAKVNGSLDSLGRMTRLTDVNSGVSTNYLYSKTRLVSVQTNGSNASSISNADNAKYEYFANGMVMKITYPTLSSGLDLTTEYTYNKALGWVESVTNKKGGTLLSSYVYKYDNNGNMTTIEEKVDTGETQITNNRYDSLNRLIYTQRSNGGTDTYTYDVRGNRLTQAKTTGNDAQSQDSSYSYDLKNVLMAMTLGGVTSNFVYYADGLRFSKTTAGVLTRYVYDFSGQVISSEKSSGEKASYIRGDRVLVKKDVTNASQIKDYYYLYNGHGDVVQIVDTSGKVVNSYAYDVWGNTTSQTEGISNPFKYTGEIYDEETGLYYLRARYYDPSMGRFINEDTYEGQINNPLSLNLYTYVENNPLTHFDPSGHYTEGQVDLMLTTARIAGSGSQLYWDIRSDLGEQKPIQYLGGKQKNQWLYLFNMATSSENSEGQASWAKSQLMRDYGEAQAINDSVVGAVLGMVGGGGKALSSLEVAGKLVKAERVGTALIKSDPGHRAASYLSEKILAMGQTFIIKGGDGVERTLLQVKGELNGNSGIYEYILTQEGKVTHQRFIVKGKITGQPNQKP